MVWVSRLQGAQRLAKSTAYGGEQATLRYHSPWFLLQGLYQPPREVVADHLKCAFMPIKPRLMLASHQLM